MTGSEGGFWTRRMLLDHLDGLGVAHATTEHGAVFRVAEGQEVKAGLPGAHTKNLFLKDARGRLWLITAAAQSAVDLKRLPERIGSARLSFGSEDRLLAALGVRSGSVTPFALVNDAALAVTLILDEALLSEDLWNLHPLRNDATTTISKDGFLSFLASLGRAPFFTFLGPSA